MTNHQIPEKARVAVLTGAKKIEIFEFPVPEIGDDEIRAEVQVPEVFIAAVSRDEQIAGMNFNPAAGEKLARADDDTAFHVKSSLCGF